jgi:hypothetical protein
MPETTIHKYGEALLRKNKIWLPRYWPVPAPAFDAMGAKNRRQFQFRVFVAF